MVVRELLTKIGFKLNEQQLNTAEQRIQKFSMGVKIGIAATVAGIAAIGKSAITAAADMEMLTTQFEVMLGSAEKATEMMEDLKTFAAETPFALEDLAKGSQQLLSFGVKTEDIMKTLKMLGDTAGGSSEKLNGLVLAYGKVTTKGKASMEELNMLAERGLPIFKVLADQLGVTRAQFFKMVSKGQVSAKDVTKAFETMTSEGGMFFEGMKKQSLTFHGLVSTMRDNFKLLLADIGTEFMPIMKEIVQVITDLTKGPLKEFVGALVGSLQPILQLISDLLTPLFQLLVPVFDALTAIINPLIEMIGALLIPVFEFLTPIIEFIAKLFERLGAFWSATFVPLLEVLGEVLSAVSDALAPFLDIFLNVFTGIMDLLQPLYEAFVLLIEVALKPLFPILKLLGVAFSFIAKVIKFAFAVLEPFFKILGLIIEIFAELQNALFELYMAVLTPLFELIGKLIPGFDLFSNILEFILWLLQPIIKGLEWTIEGIAFVVVKIKDLVKWLIDVFDDEHVFNKGGKESTVKVEMPTAAMALKKGITNKMANVNMTNNVNLTARGNLANTAGAKQALEEASRSIFTIELQKVLYNAGF
jgi:tape measure domain-containing protein